MFARPEEPTPQEMVATRAAEYARTPSQICPDLDVITARQRPLWGGFVHLCGVCLVTKGSLGAIRLGEVTMAREELVRWGLCSSQEKARQGVLMFIDSKYGSYRDALK